MNVQMPNSLFVYLVLFGGFPPLLLVYHILHDLSIDGMDKRASLIRVFLMRICGIQY